jgi:hypothetical protein
MNMKDTVSGQGHDLANLAGARVIDRSAPGGDSGQGLFRPFGQRCQSAGVNGAAIAVQRQIVAFVQRIR